MKLGVDYYNQRDMECTRYEKKFSLIKYDKFTNVRLDVVEKHVSEIIVDGLDLDKYNTCINTNNITNLDMKIKEINKYKIGGYLIHIDQETNSLDSFKFLSSYEYTIEQVLEEFDKFVQKQMKKYNIYELDFVCVNKQHGRGGHNLEFYYPKQVVYTKSNTYHKTIKLNKDSSIELVNKISDEIKKEIDELKKENCFDIEIKEIKVKKINE